MISAYEILISAAEMITDSVFVFADDFQPEMLQNGDGFFIPFVGKGFNIQCVSQQNLYEVSVKLRENARAFVWIGKIDSFHPEHMVVHGILEKSCQLIA